MQLILSVVKWSSGQGLGFSASSSYLYCPSYALLLGLPLIKPKTPNLNPEPSPIYKRRGICRAKEACDSIAKLNAGTSSGFFSGVGI